MWYDWGEMIQFKCTKCYEILEAPSSLIGEAVRCPKCELHEAVPPESLTTWEPTDIARLILLDYDEWTEQEIRRMERKAGELVFAEACVLYSLRISKCLPHLAKLQTLGSRYGTAMSGPTLNWQYGLEAAKGSPNYSLVHDFLDDLYTKYFKAISQKLIDKTSKIVKERKTTKAKINLWKKTHEEIEAGHSLFYRQLWDSIVPILDLLNHCENEIHNLQKD